MVESIVDGFTTVSMRPSQDVVDQAGHFDPRHARFGAQSGDADQDRRVRVGDLPGGQLGSHRGRAGASGCAADVGGDRQLFTHW